MPSPANTNDSSACLQAQNADACPPTLFHNRSESLGIFLLTFDSAGNRLLKKTTPELLSEFALKTDANLQSLIGEEFRRSEFNSRAEISDQAEWWADYWLPRVLKGIGNRWRNDSRGTPILASRVGAGRPILAKGELEKIRGRCVAEGVYSRTEADKIFTAVSERIEKSGLVEVARQDANAYGTLSKEDEQKLVAPEPAPKPNAKSANPPEKAPLSPAEMLNPLDILAGCRDHKLMQVRPQYIIRAGAIYDLALNHYAGYNNKFTCVQRIRKSLVIAPRPYERQNLNDQHWQVQRAVTDRLPKELVVKNAHGKDAKTTADRLQLAKEQLVHLWKLTMPNGEVSLVYYFVDVLDRSLRPVYIHASLGGIKPEEVVAPMFGKNASSILKVELHGEATIPVHIVDAEQKNPPEVTTVRVDTVAKTLHAIKLLENVYQENLQAFHEKKILVPEFENKFFTTIQTVQGKLAETEGADREKFDYSYCFQIGFNWEAEDGVAGIKDRDGGRRAEPGTILGLWTRKKEPVADEDVGAELGGKRKGGRGKKGKGKVQAPEFVELFSRAEAEKMGLLTMGCVGAGGKNGGGKDTEGSGGKGKSKKTKTGWAVGAGTGGAGQIVGRR